MNVNSMRLLRRLRERMRPDPGRKADYVFLHLPKTAGSMLKSQLPAPVFYGAPHHISAAEARRLYPKARLIVSQRAPISWYCSSYNFKMHTCVDHPVKDYMRMERNGLDDFLKDFLEFADAIDSISRWQKPWDQRPHIQDMTQEVIKTGAAEQIGFWTLNVLYYSCTHWREVLRAPDIAAMITREGRELLDVDIVLRMEYLLQDFETAMQGTGIEADLSRSINRTPTDPSLNERVARHSETIRARDGAMAAVLGYEI